MMASNPVTVYGEYIALLISSFKCAPEERKIVSLSIKPYKQMFIARML